MKHHLLFVLALLPACGGSAFQEAIDNDGGALDPLGALPEARAPFESSIVRPDAAPSPEVEAEAALPPDAGAPEVLAEAAAPPEAAEPPDAPDHPDAGEDARPMKEAASPPPDASAPETAPTCTAIGPRFASCGQSVTAYAPASYCFEVYMVPTPSVSAKPTPAECQCLETYNCACVLSAAACPSGSTARCNDGDAGPGVTCL